MRTGTTRVAALAVAGIAVLLGGRPAVGEGFAPAAECGRCHKEILEAWKNSMHAASAEDPIFRAALGQALVDRGEGVRGVCLGCHAPTWSGGKAPFGASAREGVTCDFCHSVSEVTLEGGRGVFTARPGRVKRGPWKGNVSEAHETVQSPLHTESLLCAGCHEYRSPKGAEILSTYAEWKEGPYGNKKHPCQSCHMPQVPGEVVSPSLAPTAHTAINIHEASGGHSLTQVRKALQVEIRDAVRSADRIHLAVRVVNAASGHKVPTGLPSRRVVLLVTAQTGRSEVFREERFYEKVVADAEGNEIKMDPYLFTDGAKILHDNRLGPKEERREEFDFKVPSGSDISVQATLSYLYRPQVFGREEMKVEMGSDSRIVSP